MDNQNIAIHYTSPGRNRQLVLIKASGQKYYLQIESKQTAKATASLPPVSPIVDSGYVSEDGPSSPAIEKSLDQFKSSALVQSSIVTKQVPMTLHITITLNSTEILHHSSHYSLNAAEFPTLPSLLKHIESLYLAQFPADSMYHTLSVELQPGAQDYNSTTLPGHTPPDGILCLAETYSCSSDSYSRTRISLTEPIAYNLDRYKKWYWRNCVNGRIPERKGWTSGYIWEGDELEISFGLHLKEIKEKKEDEIEKVKTKSKETVGRLHRGDTVVRMI